MQSNKLLWHLEANIKQQDNLKEKDRARRMKNTNKRKQRLSKNITKTSKKKVHERKEKMLTGVEEKRLKVLFLKIST